MGDETGEGIVAVLEDVAVGIGFGEELAAEVVILVISVGACLPH